MGMSLVSEGSWEVGDVSLPSLALVCPMTISQLLA